MPNKLSQFWQELKRRNVVRVITVYAGAAFVILELVSNISEPFGLPDWTMKLVFVILIIGLIIAVILSWIYDIHPEEGIVKTEPVQERKSGGSPTASNGWKIASYISFAVIVGLIVLNIVPHSGKKEILDKSIAVLPFIDDSPDKDNEHIINGIMEDLLINLQTIKELRVPGRTSTEQYRNNPKSIPEIASEMNVTYIVEGSGQRYGNSLRLRVQLVEGSTDKHIWADSYDEVINGPEDIFRIQSRLAESIAKELQAVITPEEKELIESIPTTSLTAYDLYQRGKDELWKYNININNSEVLDKAENYFHEALTIDSAYSLAYLGLAEIYGRKNTITEYLSENFLDSVLMLTNMALSYDKDLADAYIIRGDYYRYTGSSDKALKDYNQALKLNANAWEAYYGKARLNWNNDVVASIDNYQKAIEIHRGRELPRILGHLGMQFEFAGFHEIAKAYFDDKLVLDNDSTAYLEFLGGIEWHRGNLEESNNYYYQGYILDSTNSTNQYHLWSGYSFAGHFDEALRYCEKWLAQLDTTLIISYRTNGMHRAGYVYWQNNLHDKAEAYFIRQLEFNNWEINSDLPNAQEGWSYYDRAAVYAFRGDRVKAYEDLNKLNERTRFPAWFITQIKIDPLFDSIRDEPEFQQIVRDVEAKYQAEHERVRQWLEENDML
jgi:TolB-like protein/Tfp pilus assembly protein PilF